MIDMLKIEPLEAERIAYAEGFTMAAELFARIADLEAERDALQNQIEQLEIDLRAAQFVNRYERAFGGTN